MKQISNNNFTYNNKIFFNSKKQGEKSVEDIIQDGINELLKRAEREMAEYGDFAPIVVKLTDYHKDLKISMPSIKIVYANYEKDKTLKRLELNVPSISGKSNVNVAMELGNKQDMLNILSDKELAKRIKNNIQNAADKLNDRDFA